LFTNREVEKEKIVMFPLIVAFAALSVGQPECKAKQMYPLEEIDAVLGQSVFITGMASSLNCKLGSLVVYGKGKNLYAFGCNNEWPDEVTKAYDAAQKTKSDIWVTMKVKIMVDPRWRADGKYPPRTESQMQSRGGDPPKYYFSCEEIVKIESKKRQADGSHAIPPEKPIQK
jgi:hypothetical protein